MVELVATFDLDVPSQRCQEAVATPRTEQGLLCGKTNGDHGEAAEQAVAAGHWKKARQGQRLGLDWDRLAGSYYRMRAVGAIWILVCGSNQVA